VKSPKDELFGCCITFAYEYIISVLNLRC
jgi:hypothetical protein